MNMSRNLPSAAMLDDALPQPRRFFSCAAVLLAIVIMVTDSSMMAASLPAIAEALQAPDRIAIWLMSIYQMAIVLSIMPLAAIGESWGYHRVFRLGLLAFLCGAIFCATATDFWILMFGRCLQGLGASAVYATMATILRYSVPTDRMGRAIGNNALVVGLSASMGPSLGIFVVETFDWKVLFLTTVPVAILAGLCSLAAPIIGKGINRMRPSSLILSAACLLSLLLGIEVLPAEPTAAVCLFAVVAVSGLALYRAERRNKTYFVPFDLLRNPVTAFAAAASLFMFMSQIVASMSLPFFMVRALDIPALGMAGTLAFWPAGVAAISLLAGWLSDRTSTGVLAATGAGVLAATLFLLVCLSEAVEPFLPAFCFICGMAFGLFQSPNNRAMLLSAPRARTAGAGAVQALARQLGYSSGAAATAGMFKLMPGSDGRWILALASAVAALGFLFSVARLLLRRP